MINQLDDLYNKKSTIDRREVPRFKIKANCSFQSFKPKFVYEDYNICRIEDISLSGMAFLSENTYSLNSRLFFTIAIHGSLTEDPVNAIGDVKWVSHNKSEPYQYKIGVRFVKILQDDLINLSHHFQHAYILNTDQEFHIN